MEKRDTTDAKMVIQLTGLPPEIGSRVLREICGISDPEIGRLQDGSVVVLSLFAFCSRLGLSELEAFNLCQHIRATDGLMRQAWDIGEWVRKGDENAGIQSAPITLNNGRYASWPGENRFYDVKTGKWWDKLPSPPRYFTAWDITANLTELYLRASQMEQIIDKDK